MKTYKELTEEKLEENRKLRTWRGPYIDEIIRDCDNHNVIGNPKYPNMKERLKRLRELI